MNFLPSNSNQHPDQPNDQPVQPNKDQPTADPNKPFGQVVREMAQDAQTRKNKIVQHGQQKLTARDNQILADLIVNAQDNTPNETDADRRRQQGNLADRRNHPADQSVDLDDTSSPSTADRRVPLLPYISPRILSLAAWRAHRTLNKQFSAIRISKRGLAPEADTLPDKPVLIYTNHPSIWTATLGLYLAPKLFPAWRHYAPAEPANISTYALTRNVGFFPVSHGNLGRSALMRTARNILSCPGHMLWLPATTAPVDPRLRPMPIHNASIHLARKFDDITILPLAIEHPYRSASLPEALIRFGTPFQTLDAGRRSLEGWQNLLQRRLQMVMDRLSEESADPHPDEFQDLM